MIYHAAWFQDANGDWNYDYLWPDDYEFISLMEILRADPKLCLILDPANC